MEVVLISCPAHIDGEIDLINSMFEQGLTIFHLRKPGYSEDQLVEIIEQVKPVFHSRIKLHSAFGLMDRYRLGGIHLPVEMMGRKEIIELKRHKNISISSSFHSIGEVKRKNVHADYVFLSPIFDSISKKNYKSGFDYFELRKVLLSVNTRIIALGGCNADNLYKINELGFSGAAVLGAVWESAEPFGSYMKIKRAAAMI